MNEIMKQLLTIQANQALMLQILSSLLGGKPAHDLCEQAGNMLTMLKQAIDDLDADD